MKPLPSRLAPLLSALLAWTLPATMLSAALLSVAILSSTATSAQAAERPNFVWLLSEDNSKHYLKLYEPDGASTPQIEKLAAEGITFQHAFSCAPVCSVARTTLMTACYAPRIGTQYHRKIESATLSGGLRMFPAYLKKAGYFTTNNAKKDYNAVEGPGVWDGSSRTASWRQRPDKAMPFFHMQSFGASHESSLHFPPQQVDPTKLTHDPRKVSLAPCFPDTPLFRFTHARYLDRMQVIDQEIGKVIKQLETDGLLEDTFVFYFGDHGGVLPRSKGYVYETGLHVPLVVRIPENWQHLVRYPRGSRAVGFVSFVDFGPTLLELAGIPQPKQIDGKPFLGKEVLREQVEQRNEAFGHADRFDEKYDLCRSLRKGKYKYIRNYQPFYADSLQNNYRYRMLAYAQWRSMYHDGKLNAVQSQFFEAKPPEALYDLESDPYEVNNLAQDPQHATVLRDLRSRLARRVKQLPDLSLLPESELVEHGLADPVAYGRQHATQIAQLVDIADLCLQPFEQARPELESALGSSDRWARYWAVIACSSLGEQARPLTSKVTSLLKDPEPLVRVRAAEMLGMLKAADPRPTIRDVLKTTPSPVVSLLTLNTVVHLRDGPTAYEFPLRREDVAAKGDGVTRRLEYLRLTPRRPQ